MRRRSRASRSRARVHRAARDRARGERAGPPTATRRRCAHCAGTAPCATSSVRMPRRSRNTSSGATFSPQLRPTSSHLAIASPIAGDRAEQKVRVAAESTWWPRGSTDRSRAPAGGSKSGVAQVLSMIDGRAGGLRPGAPCTECPPSRTSASPAPPGRPPPRPSRAPCRTRHGPADRHRRCHAEPGQKAVAEAAGRHIDVVAPRARGRRPPRPRRARRCRPPGRSRRGPWPRPLPARSRRRQRVGGGRAVATIGILLRRGCASPRRPGRAPWRHGPPAG